jgi:hypothetical protein
MRTHLTLGFIAMSAILTSGLAFAQTDAAKPAQSVADPVIPAATSPALGPDGKPIQTAEEKAEEQKRVLGVLPNYRTADGTKSFERMTPQGKIHIAVKDSFDYPSFGVAAALSLIYQAENQNPDFGQGVKGYLHRYATGVGDQIIGNMMTEGFMPALLREDPRYFRKVNGRFWSRLGYASTRTLIAKDDHGKNCFNFAEVIGNGIGASIGEAYYPKSRSGLDVLSRTWTAIATDTISNVLKEFWPDIKQHYHERHMAKLAARP